MKDKIIGKIRRTVPALLPVELRKTCVKGEKEARTESRSPTQKHIVTAAMKARMVLRVYADRRDRGIVREASLAFSAVSLGQYCMAH
jgi:hypothetical protein